MGTPLPLEKGVTHNTPNIWPMYFGQMAALIKMPLGTGRPQPRPHCYMGTQLLPKKGGQQLPLKRGHSSPQFSAHVCCGQTAEWMKMSLGMEVGLGPGNIVLDGA